MAICRHGKVVFSCHTKDVRIGHIHPASQHIGKSEILFPVDNGEYEKFAAVILQIELPGCLTQTDLTFQEFGKTANLQPGLGQFTGFGRQHEVGIRVQLGYGPGKHL